MANRNINESLRKPRRTKGTPFYYQRNTWAAGGLALGGFCWLLYELWPQSKALKKDILEGKYNTSEVIRNKFLAAQLSSSEPGYFQLVSKLRARQ